MDLFANIIQDLGSLIGIPLTVSPKRCCNIRVEDSFTVQIEEKEQERRVVLATSLIELLPGKYREKVLLAALRENGSAEARVFFGFASRKNSLALFTYLEIEGLNGSLLATELESFIELNIRWKKKVEGGDV